MKSRPLYRFRSAVTGRFITARRALAVPMRSVRERIKRPT